MNAVVANSLFDFEMDFFFLFYELFSLSSLLCLVQLELNLIRTNLLLHTLGILC